MKSILVLLLAMAVICLARGHRAPSVQRDSRGRIARSATVKHDFRRTHPCPATGRTTGVCPGYVIDHVKALKRGGADAVGRPTG